MTDLAALFSSLTVGPLTLGAPLALLGLAALPVLWFLLKVMPPAPRRQSFPPLRLLRGLSGKEQTSAKSPRWLIALRLLLVTALTIALAHPVIDKSRKNAAVIDAPLLLVIDDGWASAPSWDGIRETARAFLDQAAAEKRPVRLLTTAPTARAGDAVLSPLTTAQSLRETLATLVPKPWATDRAAAVKAFEAEQEKDFRAEVVWICDGLDGEKTETFTEALRRLGPVSAVLGPSTRAPLLILPPARASSGLSVPLRRPQGGEMPQRTVAIKALDAEGRAIASATADFAAAASETHADLALPPDLAKTITRLEAAADPGGVPGAGGVHLTGDAWKRPDIGLITSARGSDAPLLNGFYYVEKALGSDTTLRRGSLADLLEADVDVLIMAEGRPVPSEGASGLDQWVRRGGVLIRFSGPELSTSGGDDLLPVRLRRGGRTLGGALSWSEPTHLQSFAAKGPLAGLEVPADVSVQAQSLADPATTASGSLEDKTWARLADGTPLITGTPHDQGWLVLIHVTADPSWSTVPLSGVFPKILDRLTRLARDGGAPIGEDPLAPTAMLDGFGRLGAPSLEARSLAPSDFSQSPDPHHPPGLYGPPGRRVAHNIGRDAVSLTALSPLPKGVALRTPPSPHRKTDLRPWLLTLAMGLLIADAVASLALRGLLTVPRQFFPLLAGVTVMGAVAAGSPTPVAAAPVDVGTPPSPAAALQTRLGWVATGDLLTDRISEAGLSALTEALAHRSSAELAPPEKVDPSSDTLIFYPLIYWPAAPGQTLPDPLVRTNVRTYLETGGMILFDGRGPENAPYLKALLSTLDIPPLAPLPHDHVLTRSFYLLDGLPGRIDGGTVWLDEGAAENDGVASVVVGASDWAGAWARTREGKPMLPVLSGGEHQREQAVRSGVNLTIYALTGTYKSDQVHLPAILERLKR